MTCYIWPIQQNKNKQMKNVAVIGAGTMGNGIAHTFAQSGFKVALIDINEISLDLGLCS